jgi:hypothetical protein
MAIPGGFSNWDEYDAWLDSVLESGRHPDVPAPLSTTRESEPYPGVSEDLRYLTHPHNGWEQTGPGSLSKTDWSGTHHTIDVDDNGIATLRSVYPDGTAQSGDFDSLRQADDRANKRAISNVLMPLVEQHGFEPSQDGKSVIRRDDDGWRHRIAPFKDYRGHTWFTYSGGNSRTGERSERDHPNLENALTHAETKQDPMSGQTYHMARTIARAGDSIWQ